MNDAKIHILLLRIKKSNYPQRERNQAIEQLFGNANSLRAPIALFDSFGESVFFDVANYPPTERSENVKGTRDVVPVQYGQIPSTLILQVLEITIYTQQQIIN